MAFSSQDRILKLLDKAQEAPRRESIRQSWIAGIRLGMSQCLTTLNWAMTFWYSERLIHGGLLTSKRLFKTFFILSSTGRVIADAGSMTTDLAKGFDVVYSVFDVLDRSTKIEPDESNRIKVEKITREVEFHEVEFAYPARPNVTIFKNLSLIIEAGKSTALVGRSGSGKSTIIRLIERFYDPLNDVIKIDGRDIKSYNLRSLRNQIALVSQEPTLFSISIKENILYGSTNFDESKIVDVTKLANADGFISGLKDGYDTWRGDRGVQLSGGQKQRIAILKNPRLLLLDEATSALDSESENVVHNALERVIVGRTSVVVAHRLSTVQNCDVIAVMDKGEVVEKGNHSSLLAVGPAGGYYSFLKL